MRPEEDSILVSIASTVATIRLNRPPANSYYKEYLEYLAEKIEEVNAHDQVKVVVIQSESAKFFCAGADIKIYASNTVGDNKEMVVAARTVTRLIAESSKIYVAAIRGHILGGGLELAMACDIRLASKGSYLIGLPEIKLGLMPGNGGTPRLIQLIGQSRALDLLVTGESIDPQHAYEIGLFQHIYDPDTFEASVAKYVNALSQGPGKAMSAVKSYFKSFEGKDFEELLHLETRSVENLYDTQDAKEGFLAFIEKRNPKFE